MTREWDGPLASFPGTHRSVSRDQCKCHGLSMTLGGILETELGMGGCVQAAGKMPAPNFSDEKCEAASTLARPSSHPSPEASGGLSREGQGVSRGTKTQGIELSH